MISTAYYWMTHLGFQHGSAYCSEFLQGELQNLSSSAGETRPGSQTEFLLKCFDTATSGYEVPRRYPTEIAEVSGFRSEFTMS